MHLEESLLSSKRATKLGFKIERVFFSKKNFALASIIILFFVIFFPIVNMGEAFNVGFSNNFDSSKNCDLNIINVQSYPVVGGEWIIKFTTTGKADLKISASNGTKWSNVNNKFDLKFLDLKNDEENIEYSWINSSVYAKNYSSESIGYVFSKVITEGKHTLKFSYGDDIEYANNDASGFTYLKNDTKTATYGYINGTLTNITYNESIRALKLIEGNTSGNYISQVFDAGSISKWNNIYWNVTYNNQSHDVIGHMWDQTGNESIVLYRNLTFGLDTFVDNSDNEIDFSEASANWNLPSNASTDNITGFCFDTGNNDAYAFLKNGSFIVDRDFDPTDSPSEVNFSDDIGTYNLLPGYSTENILGFVFDNKGDEMLVFYDDGNYSGDTEVIPTDTSIDFTFYNGNYTLPIDYSSSNILGFNFIEDADDVVVFMDDFTFWKNLSFSPFTDPPWLDINFSDFSGSTIYNNDVILSDINTDIVFQIRSDGDNKSWGEFVGPDGTNSTYYTKENGETINIQDNRYFQYKSYFSTTNYSISPYFYNVTIQYNNNEKPKISLVSPFPNGTTNIELQPTCTVWANDTEGDNLDIYWYENTTESYILRNTDSNIEANSTQSYTFTQFDTYNTTYWWKVSVTDGELWKNVTYLFTTEEEPNFSPKINGYDLKNTTGSKLNNQTGSLDNNKEYYFEINISDDNGWENVDYINITAWYDQGNDAAKYNDTQGGNLNMFLQYKNTSGTKEFNLIWPDDEVEIIVSNCSETIINSTTRIIRISFKPKSQVRWAGGDGPWDTTHNSTNDPFSWNFNISVEDSSNLKDWKNDEYGMNRFVSIVDKSKFLYVTVIPGYTAETNIIDIEYSTNYDYNMSIYFEKNLTNTTSGLIVPIKNNVYILEKADVDDDIIKDKKFLGTGEENKVEIFNSSGLIPVNNNSQNVHLQFEVGVPLGTFSGKYTSRIATKITQK